MKIQKYLCSLVLLVSICTQCYAFISDEDAMKIAKANYKYHFYLLAHETILTLTASVRSAKYLLDSLQETKDKVKIEAAKGVFLTETTEFYEMTYACLNYQSGLAPFVTANQVKIAQNNAKGDFALLSGTSPRKIKAELFTGNLMTNLTTLSPDFDYVLHQDKYNKIKNSIKSFLINKNEPRKLIRIKVMNQSYVI